MKRKILLNILSVIILSVIFSPFLMTYADTVPPGVTPGVTAQLKNPLGEENQDIKALLVSIIDNIIIKIGSIIAVGFLIWSGYLFVEARGNPGKIDKARETFTSTIVGIAILLGAKAIAMIVANTIKSVGGVDVLKS